MRNYVTGLTKQIRKGLLPAFVVGLTIVQTGCGIIPGMRDHLLDYRAEQPAATELEVPEHMSPAAGDELLIIPELERDVSIANPGEFEVPRTQPVMTVETEEKALLRTSDTDQWLLVLLPPEEVWTKLLAYFENRNITLLEKKPLKGIAVSDWISVTGSQEPIRYRALLREGIRAGITEIRLYSQNKQQEDWHQILSSNQANVGGSDLALIRQYLISSIDPSDTSVSFLARSLTAGNRTHITQTQEGVPALFIGTGFPRAWSLLGPALNDLSVKIDDRDRSAGRFYLKADTVFLSEKPGFFASLFSGEEKPKEAIISLRVQAVKGGVEVQLEIDDAQNTDVEEFNVRAHSFFKKLEPRLG